MRRLRDIRLLYRHFERKREIFVIRGEGLTLPHMCRVFLRFPHLSFMPPVPYPPLRGTFPSRGRLRYENAILKKSGEAATRTLNLEP